MSHRTEAVEEVTLDAIPDGVVLADETGLVTAMNAAARSMLRVGDGVGKNLVDVVALQDQAGNDWYSSVNPYDGPRLRSGIPEQSWFLADGTELLLTVRLQREVRQGPTTGVAVCLRTSRARERLDRERSDLVATVAHELRSPLTGVKGFVATLLAKWERLNDDQKKLMLATVNSDADRLSRLIAELLDVARIDTGRLSLYPRPVDFADSVDRVLASVRAGTGREIVLDAAPDLPQVFADPDKFVQVITNLLENAVRHGEGIVRITLEPLGEDDAFVGVRMHVDDEGSGISPEIRSRVFTKFWKDGKRGGSGLGMYIVHGLVTAHGGHVEIDDAPSGGARITVTWPEDDRRVD
ncbi:MAG TPA: PAS domain-containing sensor histidine kinase [Nocardioidaceae bacterium]|nr:PAS domain-containing sensor histidine kinase [Nocardioidaceae bacterium]